jgi:hypothetical protein
MQQAANLAETALAQGFFAAAAAAAVVAAAGLAVPEQFSAAEATAAAEANRLVFVKWIGAMFSRNRKVPIAMW